MRYLADHHQEIKIGELEQIVQKLLGFPKEVLGSFDDSEGNYPKEIFAEMEAYLKKVSLLFSAETREALASRNTVKNITS